MATEPQSTLFSPEYFYDEVYILYGVVLILLGLVATFSNGLVLLAFMTNDKLRQIGANYYIAILALSDLSIGVFIFILCGILAIVKHEDLGNVFYIWWEVVFHYCLFGSVWVVIMISHDRFLLVSDPVAYQEYQIPKHVIKKIGFLCFLGFLSIVVMEIVVLYTHSITVTLCDPLNMWECYTKVVGWTIVFMFIAEFFIPLAILMTLNILIVYKLKNRAGHKLRKTRRDLGVERKEYNDPNCCLSKELKLIKRKQERDKMCVNYEERSSGMYYLCEVTSVSLVDIKCFEVHENMDADEQSTNSARIPSKQTKPYIHADSLSEIVLNRKIKAETTRLRKAARSMSFYVAVLVVCWIPFYIVSITTAFNEFPESSYIYQQVFSCILWSNAIINPFILTNLQYRKVIFQLLERCCRRCKREQI